MENGIYIEVFAVVDGKRINCKILPIKDVSNILVNALMDGIERVAQPTEDKQTI